MKKQLERIIYACAGLTFFVPLVLMPQSFIFPFIVPKVILFRILSLVMFGAYALLWIGDKETYRPKMTNVTIALGLFMVSMALSSYAGVDWYKSLWDSHERMLGLFTLVHYFLYYLVLTSVIRSWQGLFRLFLIGGSVVMFIGMIQQANPDFLLNSGSDRSMSTLGNAIYVSGYGLFLWYLGILSFVQEKTRNWKIFSLAGAMFGFVGIFLGGTRGTLIALLASSAVMGLVYMLAMKDHKKIRIAIGAGFAALACVMLLLFAFRTTAYVSSLPAVGRLLNTSIADAATTPRIMAWGIAVESWREKPLLGWGPNNFFYAFNKYYRPEFLRSGWGETWFDNAHNVILHTLATQGIIGLATYLSIFGVSLIVVYRSVKKKSMPVYVGGIAAGFIVGHLIHNIFVFENPTSYLYFFFFLAWLNSAVAPRSESARKFAVPQFAKIGVGIAVLILVFMTDINPARANMASIQTLRALYTNPKQFITLYQEAVSYGSPHIDDIRADMARISGGVLGQYYKAGRFEDTKNMFNLAYAEIKKNRAQHPLDVRNHLQQAQLEDFAATTLGKPEFMDLQEQTLTEALALSPKRQQIEYMLADVKLDVGKNDEAIQILETSIANDDTLAEGWVRLVIIQYRVGNMAKAKEALAEMRSRQLAIPPGFAAAVQKIEQL